MQTRAKSLIEQLASTSTGFIISLLVWEFIVKPVWGIQTKFIDNLNITLLFTVVSVARGYAARRIFNLIDHNNNKKVCDETTDRDHRAG